MAKHAGPARNVSAPGIGTHPTLPGSPHGSASQWRWSTPAEVVDGARDQLLAHLGRGFSNLFRPDPHNIRSNNSQFPHPELKGRAI